MKAKQFFATAVIAGTALLSTTGAIAETYKVSVSQIVEHPALDATRNGLVDGLKAKGYEEGKI